MNYLSLFSGIGGFELGIGGLGKCVGYSEIDKPAIKTYEERFKHENFGDITAIDVNGLPDFDLLVGGFPCQAFSVAGRRRGFEEARGTLFFDIARILKDKRPGHLVLENVRGLLNHDNGQTFTTILGVLTELGYDVEWQLLNSKDWGVPQNRERVYIVGHLADRCRSKILPLIPEVGGAFESGDDAPLGAEKFIKTRHLSQNGSLISDSITLQASEIPHVVGTIDTRLGGGFRETDGIANTITSSYRKGHDNHGQRPMVITGQPKYGNGQRSVEYKITDQAPTIRATQHKSGDNQPRLLTDGRIRRLTPIECERLQGFPDNWTVGSDTQRYKQCGNAVTVNVVAAVMQALYKHL